MMNQKKLIMVSLLKYALYFGFIVNLLTILCNIVIYFISISSLDFYTKEDCENNLGIFLILNIVSFLLAPIVILVYSRCIVSPKALKNLGIMTCIYYLIWIWSMALICNKYD